MLSISDLFIQFDNFSLSVPQLILSQNGIIMLKGDNGSGKSTLLRILSGLQSHYHGDIYINDNNIRQFSRLSFVQNIAFLPQINEILPQISGEEFIQQGLYIDGFSYLDDFISQLNISHLLTKFCHNLSGGECQLLRFVRNIAIHRPIILLDEPEAFLSKSNRLLIAQVITQLATSHLIIIATHHEELYTPYRILEFYEQEDYQFIIR